MGSGGGGTSRKHHKGEQVEVGERTERTARESKGEGVEGEGYQGEIWGLQRQRTTGRMGGAQTG